MSSGPQVSSHVGSVAAAWLDSLDARSGRDFRPLSRRAETISALLFLATTPVRHQRAYGEGVCV